MQTDLGRRRRLRFRLGDTIKARWKMDFNSPSPTIKNVRKWYAVPSRSDLQGVPKLNRCKSNDHDRYQEDGCSTHVMHLT